MRSGADRVSFACGVAALCFAFSIGVAHAGQPLSEWNTAARLAAPLYLQIWLAGLELVQLCSVFFVWRHTAARWVLGGWVVSHGLLSIGVWSGHIVLLRGMVSFSHVLVWTPALIAIYATRREIRPPAAFGIWALAIVFFYGVSLVFDIPDAAVWLGSVLGA